MAAVLLPDGIPFPTPADNDRIGGWSLMYQMLVSGHWVIADSCPVLIETLPSLIRDDRNPEDCAESKYDHAPDSARYGLKSHLGSARKPISEIIQEKIKNISNYTQRYQEELRLRSELKQTTVVRRRSRHYSTWS